MAYELVVGQSALVALPHRLLDAIETFPAEDQKWMLHGITWEPMPCRGLTVVALGNPCDAVTSTNGDYTCETWVTQTAFRLYDVFNGRSLTFDIDEIDLRLKARLPVMISDGFAHELVSGAAGSTHSLKNTATAPDDVAFGTSVRPAYAMAVLESQLARDLHGQRGMIHVPPGMLAQVVASYGLEREGDHWVTPLGNWVVTDTGYVDMAGPTGQSAAASGEDWAYASGPVTYQSSGPRLLGDTMGSFDFATNTMVRWMDSFGILKFDPCPVTAVLVEYEAGL